LNAFDEGKEGNVPAHQLVRFRAKACPGLDPGWISVRLKKTRQNKNLEPRSGSIGTEKALVDPGDAVG
jgi:hypothetical protein